MIDALLIPTRNRPAALASCVASHLAQARAHGHELETFVVDDSDPEWSVENARVVRAFAHAYGVTIHHIDQERRARWVDSLVARGAPPEATRAALLRRDGFAAGAARNVGLLLTLGRRVITSDDDVTCDVEGDTAGFAGGIARGDHLPLDRSPNPTAHWFYRNDDDVPAGEPLADLVTAYEGALEAGATSTPRGRPVIAAMAGVRGGSGMGMPAAALFVDGESRVRLFEHMSADGHVATGLVRRRAPAGAVIDTPFGMAGHLALDNRALLPPFCPLGVNEDGVFFALVRRLFPESLVALVPASVRHAASPARDVDLTRGLSSPRVNDFVMHASLATASSRSVGGSVATRYEIAGAALLELSHDTHLGAFVTQWWARSRRRWVDLADAALAAAGAGAPTAWRVAAQRARNRFFVAAREGVAGSIVWEIRERLATFAEIVRSWPRIRMAASLARGIT